MKRSGCLIGLVGLVGVGIAAAVTNPGPVAYEDYATQQITNYLQQKECIKASETVQELCKLLEQESVQQQIGKLIANNTDRQNFGVLSVYKTDLNSKRLLPSIVSSFLSLPAYHFESVGIFNTFLTYQAERTSENSP